MLMGVDPRSLTHFQRGRWASSGVHGCNGVFTCSEAFHKNIGKTLDFNLVTEYLVFILFCYVFM